MEDLVEIAAHRLTILFSEDVDLPSRFRRKRTAASKPQKVKEDSEIERRFRASVDSWARLIQTMLSKIDNDQAWRFIRLVPKVDAGQTQLSHNKDFCDVIDYLILRRDREHCDPSELGGLSQLSVAFQREIEKRFIDLQGSQYAN